MSIFTGIRAAFGNLKFEELSPQGSYPFIRIKGINTRLLEIDLRKIFKTSKVYSSIFDQLDRYTLVFPSFFAIEVEMIMQRIISEKTRLGTSRRTAKMIIDGLYNYTWLKNTKIVDYPKRLDQNRLKYFYKKPLHYQQAFIDMFDRVTFQYSLNGILLDAIMGSGKTITSLYISECANKDIKVIVSPNNAVETVWAKTLREEISRPIQYWTTKSNTPYKGEEYVIIHYEGLRKGIEALSQVKSKTFSLIIDECHNFAEYKSQQTQNLIALHKQLQTKLVIPQSGTTFKAIGAEIIAMMILLDPTFTEELAKRFSKMYGASATEALQLLQHRMGLITHKVVKEDVGLPEPIIKNFTVSSPIGKQFTLPVVKEEMIAFVEQRQKYYKQRQATDERNYYDCINDYKATIKSKQEKQDFEQYQRNVATIIATGAKDCPEQIAASNSFERLYILPRLSKDKAVIFKEAKTIHKYVNLKINGECLGQVLAKKRKECAQEIARNIPYETFIESTDKKTLIYTVYVDTLKTIKETLEKQDYKCLAVFGETNKDINSIVQTFGSDESYNPLVATFKSLSTAIPLTMADCMIMVDTPFRDYIFQQTVARINRLGANTQTHVYIAALDTGNEQNMSTRTLSILQWSQSQIEAITGVKSPFEITDEQMSIESHGNLSYYDIDKHVEDFYLRKLS